MLPVVCPLPVPTTFLGMSVGVIVKLKLLEALWIQGPSLIGPFGNHACIFIILTIVERQQKTRDGSREVRKHLRRVYSSASITMLAAPRVMQAFPLRFGHTPPSLGARSASRVTNALLIKYAKRHVNLKLSCPSTNRLSVKANPSV